MSLLPELAETIQGFIDNWTKGLQEMVDSIFDPEDDNENEPFYIGQDLSCCGIFLSYEAEACNTGSAAFVLYRADVTIHNNIISTDVMTFGRCNFDNRWSVLSPEQADTIQSNTDAVVLNNFTVHKGHEGELNILFGASDIADVVVTYGEPPVNHYENVYKQLVTANSSIVKNSRMRIQFNAITYTTDAQGYITPSNMFNLFITDDYFFTLKTYPVVCTSHDTTWINNYVSGNGASNNYNRTYQTSAGDNVTVYYGDNYVIINDNGNQMTYNDVKTGLDIAVTQINDDNDTDIKVPTYRDNKYGPEPPIPELISDNQEDGGNYNHAEFTKVYACTSAELNDLYQWMGGGSAGSSGTSPVTVPDNFDPMNRIVGLIGYPMVIDAGVGDQTTFTFRNAANQTINTGWSTYKYANFDRAFDFGTVDIPSWEELANKAPFLDYSATVEIYIPFCGIVGLDPQAVMGCTLSCKMWIDFVTGDCSAVVYTNYGGEDAQHPVAFVSGNCGSAEVVSANAFGAYQGAKAQASHKMSQAIIGGFKDLATSVIGGATTGFTRGAANPSGAGGSAGMRAGAIGSVIGGAMNLGVNLTLQNLDNRYAVQVAKNALGTTISGSFGQQTSWYYMDTPYIKVTWPTPISKDVELYGKTFGVPVHRSGALSEFTGYTVCNNVDVSEIAGATASELATIKQFLETGVFIKEGGDQ